MTFEFEIITSNQRELSIIDDFGEMICQNIRNDIMSGIIKEKMDGLEQDLINSSWILWYKKPKGINMTGLVKSIVNNIVCRRRLGNLYIIRIPPTVRLEGSNTPLDSVARFIDMGTEITPCTMFISNIFHKYEDNLASYWNSYVNYKLHINPNSEILIK